MHRLRTTFTRSRTPTGAEMKTQSSLEVPKQVRSASFDEIQLDTQRTVQFLRQHSSNDEKPDLLTVPQQHGGQRSRSFDSAGHDEAAAPFLEVPKRFQRRRSSNSKTPPPCVHCQYMDEYEKAVGAEQRFFIDHIEVKSLSYSEISSSEDESDEGPKFGNLLLPPPSPGITFTLSPTNGDRPEFPPINGSPPITPCYPTSPAIELALFDDPPPSRARRRSISRQEAIFVEPTGNSLENVTKNSESAAEDDEPNKSTDGDNNGSTDFVQDIYLTVPDLKRDRAASVDSCFSKLSSSGKTEELQPPDGGFTLTVPVNSCATRSRSVDIVLPTDEQARYKALALAGPSAAAYNLNRRKSGDSARQIRQTPDWSENAVANDHLWVPTSVSGDFCYVGDSDCTRHGSRMKCSACKIIAHASCISVLMERTQMACKPTFRDVGVRQYREQTTTHHHWVHRRTEKGKCKQCGKSLQAKLSFSSKEIVALSCAWCKSSYHNKESCFNSDLIGEECTLGSHSNIIVPPSWIVKLPRKGNFKSSLRKSPKKKAAGKRKSKEKESKTFVIKPIPTANVTPVLVFINPKSGGNQGAKLLQKFQWLLNPRQVFDLTQGGPKLGLEMFRKVPQLRVLACGGDGTVGWVLSILDVIGISPAPAVGVLPLGTGNDLARALGWGGGYTDEPIGKILSNIADSDTILLDRWSLDVTPNPNAEQQHDEGKDKLPLNVVNNYFSFGVDAHIALEFHEAREAHPEKFNSRLRNKMFYGQAGGKDLLRRKWKNLADMVTLECDGKDLTHKLKEHKVHAIVFLNIQSYGGGTHPWNNSGGQYKPATDDGLIEVVGLTTYQLPLLQAGGHGTCIAQCKSAKIITSKTIPMQVDGEAAKLKPSIIELNLLNKAVMLAKKKPGRTNVQLSGFEPLFVSIHKISMTDYEQYHYDKDRLSQSAINLGNIEVNPISDLEQIRNVINKFCDEIPESPKLSADWCFVDSCTAERFFRVDRAQEHLHYVTDIANEIIFILDSDSPTMPQTPDDDGLASPSSLLRKHTNYSSESSENLDKESREGTPSTPNKQFFNRSLSGPGSGATSDSLSPCADCTSRKCSQASQSSQGSQNNDSLTVSRDDLLGGERQMEPVVNFKRNLLEKTTDGIIKAAKVGDLLALKDLHSQGYSLLSIDATGQTALHYGSKYGHRDIVKYLIAYAPNSIVNMVDNAKGQTALHKAAGSKQRGICYMLVAAGASLTMKDSEGLTPMMQAFAADDHDLAAYLESQEKFLQMDYGTSI
ncbi:eye-specific diacylglycerol kinase isoform X3 [Bradysia coprophila]|uniref:eye-specific diacylglycerol kinase isoform X3 n=1 Tax=Bradysia coprophila TaxID=38358 RepID=UPI00187DCF8E|nr:eye-specific diacylglycerol kinase isoform X3 [Bradysia coprophila]